MTAKGSRWWTLCVQFDEAYHQNGTTGRTKSAEMGTPGERVELKGADPGSSGGSRAEGFTKS